MIGSIRGEVIDKEEGSLLIDVGGVGYYILAPTTLLDLLEIGITTQLYTHLYVREQELTLFGFPDREELELFRTLLKVQGIGPKVALAILVLIDTLAVEIDKGCRHPGVGIGSAAPDGTDDGKLRFEHVQ